MHKQSQTHFNFRTHTPSSVLHLKIFGDDAHHMDLRQRCMDFIAMNKTSFESFVDGESSFDDYVKSRRNDGVWGYVRTIIVCLFPYLCAA